MSLVADLIASLRGHWTDSRRLPPELVLRVRTAIETLPEEKQRAAWVEAQSWIVLDHLERERWDAALAIGRELAAVAEHLPQEAHELGWLARVRAARVERLAGDPDDGLELLRPLTEKVLVHEESGAALPGPELVYEAYAERIRLEETRGPSWVYFILLQVLARHVVEAEIESCWLAGELLFEIARRHHRRGDLVSARAALESAREAGHRPDTGSLAELSPLYNVRSVEIGGGDDNAVHGFALGLLGAIRGRVDPALVERQARSYLEAMRKVEPSTLAVLVAKVAHRGAEARAVPAPLLWEAHCQLVTLGPHRFAHPPTTAPDPDAERLLHGLMHHGEVPR